MASRDLSSSLSRRAFLGRSAMAAGAGLVSLSAIGGLNARAARAAAGSKRRGPGFGPLAPVMPSNPGEVADAGFPDLAAFAILALPHGFHYRAFSFIGGTMSDGNPVPVNHDGMAAFGHPRERHVVRLIRNHEDRAQPGRGSVRGPMETRYDRQGGGGNTTLDYDERSHRLLRDWISLNGTIVNCAGGIGYAFRSWLTCEETTASKGQGSAPGWEKNHGYVFEVPLGSETTTSAVPIPAMGRFAHEAVAIDQSTGVVYLTEDAGSGAGSGFYRFVPNDPRDLLAGGRLEMLGIDGRFQYDTREGQTLDEPLPVRWFEILNPDPANAGNSSADRTFNQGWLQGGAKFNRLEGCWWDSGSVFFVATSGGDAKNGDVNADGFHEGFGQVWQYTPADSGGGVLKLIFESPGSEVLDSPDNLVVTPRGGLILCEDDASSDGDTHPLAPGLTDVNRLIGISPAGEAFEFAVNRLNDAELAGACFSPSGHTLFVNVFGDGTAGSGMTLAITGPWRRGLL